MCASQHGSLPARFEKLVSPSYCHLAQIFLYRSNVILTLSYLQVKLSGSHLTPQCYSFITYAQVLAWFSLSSSVALMFCCYRNDTRCFLFLLEWRHQWWRCRWQKEKEKEWREHRCFCKASCKFNEWGLNNTNFVFRIMKYMHTKKDKQVCYVFPLGRQNFCVRLKLSPTWSSALSSMRSISSHSQRNQRFV